MAATPEIWEACFRSTTRGICVLDVSSERIVGANPAFAAQHGTGVGELIGRRLSELMSAEDAARLPELVKESGPEGPVRYEAVHVRDDGSLFPVAVESLAVAGDRGTGRLRIGWFDDITVERAREREWLLVERHSEGIFEAAPNGLAVITPAGRFVRVNRAFCETLGYQAHELHGLSYAEIIHPEDVEAAPSLLERMQAGEDRLQVEKRYVTKAGRVIWAQFSASLIPDADGSPAHLIVQLQDISERKLMEGRMRRLAETDPLTGVWNSRRFQEELRAQISRVDRYNERVALLVIDLDGFKRVNDSLGHDIGDRLLRGVADTLRARLRASDSVARIGGDEFAVLLLKVSAAEAERAAEDHRARIGATAIGAAGSAAGVTASIGVLHLDGATISARDAIIAADRAMYAAKDAGRDGVVVRGLGRDE